MNIFGSSRRYNMNSTNNLPYYQFSIDYPHRINDVAEVREDNPREVILIFKDGSIWSFWMGDNNYDLRRISKDGNLTDQEYAREFGIKLTHIMEKQGLTQVDLAELLGTTQATVSRLITGRTIINLSQMRKIARVLNMTVEELQLKF